MAEKTFVSIAKRECDAQKRVLELIGSIFFYGQFKAQTPNEKELEQVLKELGYFFETEDQLIEKVYGIN